jgi:hypothetical protein
MRSKSYRIPLPASRHELAQVLEHLREDTLEEADRQLRRRLVQQVLGPDPGPPPAQPPVSADTESENAAGPDTSRTEPEAQRRGHGRRSATEYPGARRVCCPDATRQAGDHCVCGGRLYQLPRPTIFLRFTGPPLVGAPQYEQSVLRCSSCQQRFPAPLPDGVPTEKYDATAEVAMGMAK